MQFADYDMEDFVEASGETIAKGHLRFEMGWTEVRSGLGLILRGYIVLILAAVVLGASAAVLLHLSPEERRKIPWQLREVGLWMGLGLFGLLSLYCYGCVIVGHWRCLMNVPERRGARWLMFGCLTCILAGPALNVASNLTGVEKGAKWERGIAGVKELRMSKEGAIMAVGSAAVQALGGILFILFLRAVAGCFEDRFRVRIVDVYLVFSIILLIATIGLVLTARDFDALVKVALLIGAGLLVNFLGYLFVIGMVHSGITSGLARLAPRSKNLVGGSPLTSRAALPLN
jgi:hypothetical protein